MSAELNDHASVDAPNVRVLEGLEALTIRTRGKIRPGTRYFTTSDGNEIFIKEVAGGLNVIRPKTELPIHFVKDSEVQESRESGYLSILNDCTEIRIEEA